jgi:predicted outer membrane repeat protein
MFNNKSINFYIECVVRISFLLFVIVLILGGNLSSTRAAASILYAKPEVSGNGDCSSWDDACTLQIALINAISGDQIWVMAGNHLPTTDHSRIVYFHLKDGVSVYGGFNGTETSLEQRDWISNVTVLSGDLNRDDDGFNNNGENSYHVVIGVTGAALDGVTIRGGNANETFFPGNCGGGLYNLESDPSITNVIFTSNDAGGYYGGLGGGLCNSDSNPTLSNVIFTQNKANSSPFGSNGGGIYNSNSSPTLMHVSFYENQAVSGGAIANDGYSNPVIGEAVFIGNSASFGGAIYNKHSSPSISHAIFANNSAIYVGGGIANEYESGPILNDVTLTHNTTSAFYGSGGGIYSSVSTSTLHNVTFIGNSSVYGGGMYNTSSSSVLQNVTFIENTADDGGGMHNVISNSDLTNTTFRHNTSSQGGAIFNYKNCITVIANSIFWEDAGLEIYDTLGSTTTVSNSDVYGGYDGSENINVDPLLAPLGDYGGAVETIALLPGSPAIDATSNNCPDTDARGLPRSSPSCDLGAFESQDFSLFTSMGDNQSTPIYNYFPEPLCVGVTATNGIEPVDGGQVSFIPPASGPSATILNSPATFIDGIACSIARAKGTIGGPYEVSANTNGASATTFTLTNVPGEGMAVFLPIIQNPDRCLVGFSIEDPANDVTPAYIDVVFFNSSISGDSLTATFTLRDIPEKLTFNRYGLRQYTTEYDWAVYINVDNSTDTGTSGLGIDYLIDAIAYVHQADTPINLPIENGVWALVWKYVPPSSYMVIAMARLTINRQAHILQLVGNIPGLTGKARLIFWTYDANPQGAVQEDTSKCGLDNYAMSPASILSGFYRLNELSAPANK